MYFVSFLFSKLQIYSLHVASGFEVKHNYGLFMGKNKKNLQLVKEPGFHFSSSLTGLPSSLLVSLGILNSLIDCTVNQGFDKEAYKQSDCFYFK